ncbi:hypothetical protein mhp076 [Mesomycoplasma hyopneumoniae 232]|uniref:Uncharacterized protein n=1 Tax=Mesomycoplasma hyopneumoniae (strain 232) TaxID=295358 RepID=Q601X5_MESH2|nr:hypothetical protein mhp076 [Mesomycoplasma hyopneumoniae 232]
MTVIWVLVSGLNEEDAGLKTPWKVPKELITNFPCFLTTSAVIPKNSFKTSSIFFIGRLVLIAICSISSFLFILMTPFITKIIINFTLFSYFFVIFL